MLMKININKKFIKLVAAATASTIALAACSNSDGEAKDSAGAASSATAAKLNISASFYPIAWLAEEIGGDAIAVSSVTPANVEPHDFELAPADVAALDQADAVFYVAGFQPSLDDAVANISGPQIVNLANVVELQPADPATAHSHQHGNESEHEAEAADHEAEAADHAGAAEAEHEQSELGLDPHFWLDPRRMKNAADTVAATLASLDEANASKYQENYNKLASELDSLDREFIVGLAKCNLDTVVTSHAAFSYLTNTYNLEQAAISGVDPEAEPTPADLAAVKEVVQATGTTTVFTEELVSPKTAEALAAETGASTAVLSPIESAPEAGDYLAAMRANLAALRTALQCE